LQLTYKIHKLNLKETFSISYGNYTHRNALIVTLQQNGMSGYGECTEINYYNIDLMYFEKLLEENKKAIEIQKIVDPPAFYLFLESLQLPHFLLSALDCAFWDLYGKLEQKTFFDLNKIDFRTAPKSSITISVAPIKEQIKKIEASKWEKFKVKCKGFNEEGMHQLVQLNRTIALDSNASFTIADCQKIESIPAASGFSYFEQPMKVGQENYVHLNKNTYPNWMADEDLQNISQLQDLQNHYTTVNIKLMKCGGLTPAIKMIAQARKLHFKIMMGCMTESTIGISAGAVLAPLVDFVDLDGANLIANDIAKGTKINEGNIEFSEKFGLGIEIL
jgi:L-Ala-D/L-Glu epimerase